MSTDYTQVYGNRLRDKTVAGLISNIIREVQQGTPLFQVAAIGGMQGAGTTTGGPCGLSFTPATLSFVIPTGDTGQIGQTVTVKSQVAQTVTFSVTEATSPWPACLGVPTVTPSSFIFTAGQSTTVLIMVPYTSCANTVTATVNLNGTTNSGCTTNNPVTGNVSVSDAAAFVLEITGYESGGSCFFGASANVFGAAANGTGYGDGGGGTPCQSLTLGNSGCPNSACYSQNTFTVRLRSVNGFIGNVTLTVTEQCTYSGCPGSTTVSLTAGQTLVVFSNFCATVTAFKGATLSTQANWTGTSTVTAGSQAVLAFFTWNNQKGCP